MDSATTQAPPHDFLGGMGVKFYRYRALVKKKWWILALTIGLGLALEGWSVYKQPHLFESSANLWVRPQTATRIDEINFNGQSLETFAENTKTMLTSDQVLDRARKRVALEHPQLASLDAPKVTINNPARTTFFTVIGTGTEPELTQLFVDAVTQEFRMARSEQQNGVVGSFDRSLSADKEKLQKELQQAQARELEFERKNNRPLWEEQLKSEGQTLTDLNARKTRLKTELLRLQHLTAEQFLSQPTSSEGIGEASNSGTDSGASADSAVSSGLYQEYVRQRQLYVAAKTRYDERARVWKPKHPRLRQLKADLDQIEQSIDLLKTQSEDARAQLIKAKQADLESVEQTLASVSNELGDAMKKNTQYQALHADVAQLQGELTATSDKKASIAGSAPDMFNASDATPALEKPKKLGAHLVTGLIAGLLIGGVILFLLDRADDRLASSSETMERFTESILGQIPDVTETRGKSGLPLLQTDDERFTYAESFRSLRSSLIFMPNQGDLKTLLVTSAIPNEGKSTVVSNLAITMAAAGAKVLLVDADLRRGDLASLFDTDGRTGLSNILRGEVKWESAVRKTSYPTLSLIPRGPVTNQSSELLLLPIVDSFLEELKSKFDLVLFNTAPILATDDTPTLAPHFDGALMVVRAQFTSSRLTQNALQALYQRQVNVLGLVLNCVDAEVPDYYYYRYPKYYAA